MSFYDHYANRSRNGLGVRLKVFQAKQLFALGLRGLDRDPQTVLELGPGDGYIARLSSERNIRYTGVEGSVAVADKLASDGFHVIRRFVPPLPQEVGKFDVCYMLHVIEHMKDMDTAVRLVAEIREGLNEGGTLVVACPDYMRWKQHFYDSDYTHQLPFTRRRLSRMLADEGFEVTYQTIYTGPFFGYGSLPVFWLARLLYPQFLDDFIFRHFRNDLGARGFFTFIPNLVVVAKRVG